MIILVLVLIVFGAGKLPQVGAALGKGLSSFKKEVKGVEASLATSDRDVTADKLSS
jgi:sec-independent protein translocase protein TatA